MLFNCRLQATLRHFLPCLAPLRHLTADKKEIKDFPKLPSANFFYPQNVRRNGGFKVRQKLAEGSAK